MRYKKTTQIKEIYWSYFFKLSIISICCSLNKYTHNLINLSKLKTFKNAILINTSRGEVINEKDLIFFWEKEKIYFLAQMYYGEINATNLRSS